jgi:hypothetical protein
MNDLCPCKYNLLPIHVYSDIIASATSVLVDDGVIDVSLGRR